jgi:hypothetical protein
MIRGKKVPFRASASDLDRLFACNRESVKVWNTCVQIAKQFSLNHGRKVDIQNPIAACHQAAISFA